MSAAFLHGLLVGIDHYLAPVLPGLPRYPPLTGGVRDVRRVERMLWARGVPAERIELLTSTSPAQDGAAGGGPIEPPERRPTYENIVAALRRLRRRARRGDHLYLHYSGHGGRVGTAYPRLKGIGALDECLVPWNIGLPEARPVRDVELHYLVRELTDAGLTVTLVLDCCHSGGLLRSWDEPLLDMEQDWNRPRTVQSIDEPAWTRPWAVRGIDQTDWSARPTDSAVATADELADAWLASLRERGLESAAAPSPPGAIGLDLAGMPTADEEEGPLRDFGPGSDWLPAPPGCLLMAACAPYQAAVEAVFEDGRMCGALTHWLLAGLGEEGLATPGRRLRERALALSRRDGFDQTPMVEGDGERGLFGDAVSAMLDAPGERLLGRAAAGGAPRPAAERSGPLILDRRGDWFLLEAGSAQGVSAGDRFGAGGLACGLMAVEVAAHRCWAIGRPGSDSEPPPAVRPALRPALRPAVTAAVTAAPRPGDRVAPAGLARSERLSLLIDGDRRLGEALARRLFAGAGRHWLRDAATAADSSSPGSGREARLTVAADGSLALACTPLPFPLQLPPLPGVDPADPESGDGEERLLALLIHLARLRRIADLCERRSPPPAEAGAGAGALSRPVPSLADRLVLRLERLPRAEVIAGRWEPRPLAAQRAVLEAGDRLCITVTNRNPFELHLALLDVTDSGAVRQLFPATDEGDWRTLPADASLPIELPALPPPAGRRCSRDLLQLIVTDRPTAFRWLELPPLAEAAAARPAAARPAAARPAGSAVPGKETAGEGGWLPPAGPAPYPAGRRTGIARWAVVRAVVEIEAAGAGDGGLVP